MQRCAFASGACLACVLVPLFASAAPPLFHQKVASAGPLLWYRFDEPSGNSINYGSLGTGYNAVYVGSVTRGVESPGGDVGIGLSSAGYLESLGTSALTGNPTFSIETVVNLAEPGNASLWGPFLHWGDASGSRTGREVYFGIQNANNHRIYAGFYNAGVCEQGRTVGNTWIHVVWTRQGGNDSETGSIVYINGRVVDIQRDPNLTPGYLAASAINVTGTRFRINAGRDFPGARFFTGAMDELALYNRVLSPAEIRERAALISCPADFDNSGFVDTDDFTAFVVAFEAGTDNADFDGSGFVDTDDYDAFVGAFEAGC